MRSEGDSGHTRTRTPYASTNSGLVVATIVRPVEYEYEYVYAYVYGYDYE